MNFVFVMSTCLCCLRFLNSVRQVERRDEMSYFIFPIDLESVLGLFYKCILFVYIHLILWCRHILKNDRVQGIVE